jgi:glycosyltransferase involved in cell wall biosynthesis
MDQTMKILIINDYTEKIGGCETYLYNVKNELEKKGHKTIFIGGRINLSRIKRYVTSFYNFEFKKKVATLIKSESPDIIYARSIVANISPSFLITASKYNIPVVLNHPRYEQFLQVKINPVSPITYIRWLRRQFYLFLIKNYVDIHIAQSIFMEKFLQNYFCECKIVHINHPLFWDQTSTPKKLNVNEKIKILYAGRLVKVKGLQYLLDSARILHSKGYDFNIKIVGDGEYKETLLNLVERYKLAKIVTFIGHVEQNDLINIYNESHIFISPCTYNETFGLTIVESLSQGTPVITTKGGAQQEHIQDGYNGFLVEKHNSQMIADKIEYLATNPKIYSEMSKNSIESSKKYSKEDHIEKLISVFQELI